MESCKITMICLQLSNKLLLKHDLHRFGVLFSFSLQRRVRRVLGKKASPDAAANRVVILGGTASF